MKEFRKFFVGQILVVAALVTVLFGVAFSNKNHQISTVDFNDYIETVKENWDSLAVLNDKSGQDDSGDLRDEENHNDIDDLSGKGRENSSDILNTTKNQDNIDAFSNKLNGTDVMILDKDNQIVYSSSEAAFSGIKSPLDAMSNNMLTFPVNDDDVFLGTLVIKDPSKIKYDHAMQRTLVVSVFVILIMLFSYAAFFWYINRSIIKPFKRMKNYAALIAQGKLDEPLIMERNNIFGIFTESFDTMREELRASRERELALKLKEKELVASLSHDLKTPVAGIKIICQLLEVKVEDEYVKAKLLNINNKTEEINVLLNNLLNSALEDLNEMNVDCKEETSDILGMLLEEHDPHKKVACEDVPDCIINVDRNRLSQVIGNIISNSYKYANTQIDVTYRFCEKYLEMSIRDHGEGVEPEELDLITNKFYRGKKNTSEKEGSGLGLYISKELMKKMDGKLICKSDGDGFCVMLMIPLA